MSIPFFTTKDYIIRGMGLLGLFRILKRAHATDIGPAITGVKLGDRVLLAIRTDIALAASIATRSGLSGRTVALAPAKAAADAFAAQVQAHGGLAEPLGAPLNMLPLDSASFDVAVADDTLMALAASDRRGALAELFRVLRPGGRLVWIERHPRAGLFKLAPDSHALATTTERERLMRDAGFRATRILAEAGSRTYLEGTKAASA